MGAVVAGVVVGALARSAVAVAGRRGGAVEGATVRDRHAVEHARLTMTRPPRPESRGGRVGGGGVEPGRRSAARAAADARVLHGRGVEEEDVGRAHGGKTRNAFHLPLSRCQASAGAAVHPWRAGSRTWESETSSTRKVAGGCETSVASSAAALVQVLETCAMEPLTA